MHMSDTTSVQLTSLLQNRIFICPCNLHKQDVLSLLVKQICQIEKQLVPGDILNQIFQREKQLSTTLDTGLSIPHVRIEGLVRIQAALALFPQPIAEENGKQIRAMFLFLSPARSEFFQLHLQVLSMLAETFTSDFIDRLNQFTEVTQIQRLLQKASSDVK